MPDTIPDSLPPTQPPPATPPAAPPTPPVASTPPAPPTLKDQLLELGFEGVTDEDAGTRLLAAFKAEREKQNQLAEQFKAALDQVRSAAQAQPQPAAPPSGSTKPPAIDRRLVEQYLTKEGWKDGTPDQIKAQFAEWQSRRQAFAESLLDDPESALELEQKFEAYFEKKFGQVSQQQQEQAFIEKTLGENAAWLFEKDPITGQARRGALTTEGQVFNQFFIDAQQRGWDFRSCWDYALALHKAAKLSAQQQTTTQAATAQQQRDAANQNLLNRARGDGGNRTGSLPTPGENRATQRNRSLTFGEKLLQNARRNGMAVET